MLTGKKVVLPVWHEVTREEVFSYSLALADKWAANTQEGLDIVISNKDDNDFIFILFLEYFMYN